MMTSTTQPKTTIVTMQKVSSDVPASKQKVLIYNTIFNQLSFEVEYNDLWESENLEDGVLGNNEDMPIIPVGKMSKGESPEGRKFIFIGTRFGTIAIATESDYHLYSFPNNGFFDLLLYKESIGLPDHKHLLGWGTNKNIGITIEEMAKMFH